jgi:hypothetical protein
MSGGSVKNIFNFTGILHWGGLSIRELESSRKKNYNKKV